MNRSENVTVIVTGGGNGIGRATPEDIAPSLVYLASSDSDYMTGSTLSIDGGRTI
jgi:NAD(P)-dependent dehydrogenase (short-subunit alcohol dehydrogenase family)